VKLSTNCRHIIARCFSPKMNCYPRGFAGFSVAHSLAKYQRSETLREKIGSADADKPARRDVIYSVQSTVGFRYIFCNEKALRETQTLRAGCSKAEPNIFAPPQTPSRGTGWPKLNQLETVTTFTYRPNLVKIDERNFELSCRGNRPTNTYSHKQRPPARHRQD